MTLKLLEKAPGVFAAGVAVAPVTKWELYDTAYTERYLGNPAIDPKPYRTSDALDDAVKIRDPLLLVHGMSDDNVVFQNSTELYARLQQAQAAVRDDGLSRRDPCDRRRGAADARLDDDHALPRRQGARQGA